jgi:Cu(I)/Ag(I) efflux system protein CusF
MEIPMKTLALTTLAFAATLSASAQQKMDDMKGMNTPAKPVMSASAPQATHSATGVVKKIDAQTGLVTFAHEAVPSMNWPAMTMGFQVKDKMLLDKLAVGKKVDFEFVQGSKGYVVTSVK